MIRCNLRKILGWPESSFGFFHTIIRKTPDELSGQPNSKKIKRYKSKQKSPQFLKLSQIKECYAFIFIRILFRRDLSNLLRYVPVVFAKECVECSFSLQWNMFFWSLKLVFLLLFHKQAVVARMHHWTPSGSQPHILESSTIFLLREFRGLAQCHTSNDWNRSTGLEAKTLGCQPWSWYLISATP